MRTEAIDILKVYGIRPSEQRTAVLHYLLNHPTHPSVDTIYEELHISMPTLSRTTVYNVLRNLAGKGIVKMLTIDDKNVRYDADIIPHAHLRCNRCGKLFDLPQPEIGAFDCHDFRIDDVQVYCHGLCPECNAKDKNTEETSY